MASKIKLYPDQREALEKLYSGAILCGGTGSGKTYTALFFYKERYSNLPLYVITTAKKRDDKDWQREAQSIGITEIVVDSWNNIAKYTHVQHAFFIFDEQRVIGYGKWSRSFIKISKSNKWILTTATPGDTWTDYIPVFIANGFYKNKTEFDNRHVEYNRFVRFPQVKRYHDEGRLLYLRNKILVTMTTKRHTVPYRQYVNTKIDEELYSVAYKDRWNPFTDAPIKNASELLHTLRRISSMSEDRKWYASYLISLYSRVIVFYNFNYELEILKDICNEQNRLYLQWNGHAHDHLPYSGDWVYLVQYTAGAEGWNCTDTDAMVFYSPNYSYRTTKQSEGRIDRRNTSFRELYYFYLYNKDSVEIQILNAVKKKKKFNEGKWIRRHEEWFTNETFKLKSSKN